MFELIEKIRERFDDIDQSTSDLRDVMPDDPPDYATAKGIKFFEDTREYLKRLTVINNNFAQVLEEAE